MDSAILLVGCVILPGKLLTYILLKFRCESQVIHFILHVPKDVLTRSGDLKFLFSLITDIVRISNGVAQCCTSFFQKNCVANLFEAWIFITMYNLNL